MRLVLSNYSNDRSSDIIGQNPEPEMIPCKSWDVSVEANRSKDDMEPIVDSSAKLEDWESAVDASCLSI